MWMTVDRDSQITLTRQIYGHIKNKILDGSLSSGQRLPATRRLSAELDVSRNIILDVYSQLVAEGYLTARHGSGTVVAEGLEGMRRPSGLGRKEGDRPECRGEIKSAPAVSRRQPYTTPLLIDFRSGVPALDLFPHREWGRLYRDVCDELPPAAFGYCGAAGVWELREQIACYLLRTRGIHCNPKQILITSGSTQGLSMIAGLLGTADGTVLIEDPSHAGLREVIAMAGCRLEGVPVDALGLDTGRLEPGRNVDFIYTTPSHQYPLGGILPIRRRLDLIRYAEKNDCFIVEDDYDSEFRYVGAPVSSLYELCPERVIYLGSFSKLLAPGIRLGFLILPEMLLAGCKKLKVYSDVHTDALTQHTLACLMKSGGFERHIWKMKKLYGRKRNHLLQKLREQFMDAFEVLGHESGLHLVVRFPGVEFTSALLGTAARQGVAVYPTKSCYIAPPQSIRSEIIMGYSHLNFRQISDGVEILKQVIAKGF